MEKIENPSPDERCSFCFSAVNNPLRYGDMYRYKNIITHYFCILMSNGIKQNGNDDEGLYGFLLEDIQKGLDRARDIKCIYCKRGGATAQCNHYVRSIRKKCLATFHLTCGVTHGSQHLFYGQYQSVCHLHRRAQKIPAEYIKDSAVSCGMCFDTIHDVIASSSLWGPCCKNYYFHRDCVQQLAFTSGGYHFRCPLCNNENQFKIAMQKCGIFVPIRDALWETEPNAFSELYVEHNQCDVEPCLCPHSTKEGDRRTYNSGAWDLIRCVSCGSEGTHRPCSGLSLTGDVSWNCGSCQAVLKRKQEDGDGERDEIQKTIEPDTCCAYYCVSNKGRDYQTDKGMYKTVYCMECELSWIHARCRTIETNGAEKGSTSEWTCVGCLAGENEDSPETTPSTSTSQTILSTADKTAIEEKTKKPRGRPPYKLKNDAQDPLVPPGSSSDSASTSRIIEPSTSISSPASSISNDEISAKLVDLNKKQKRRVSRKPRTTSTPTPTPSPVISSTPPHPSPSLITPPITPADTASITQTHKPGPKSSRLNASSKGSNSNQSSPSRKQSTRGKRIILGSTRPNTRQQTSTSPSAATSTQSETPPELSTPTKSFSSDFLSPPPLSPPLETTSSSSTTSKVPASAIASTSVNSKKDSRTNSSPKIVKSSTLSTKSKVSVRPRKFFVARKDAVATTSKAPLKSNKSLNSDGPSLEGFTEERKRQFFNNVLDVYVKQYHSEKNDNDFYRYYLNTLINRLKLPDLKYLYFQTRLKLMDKTPERIALNIPSDSAKEKNQPTSLVQGRFSNACPKPSVIATAKNQLAMMEKEDADRNRKKAAIITLSKREKRKRPRKMLMHQIAKSMKKARLVYQQSMNDKTDVNKTDIQMDMVSSTSESVPAPSSSPPAPNEPTPPPISTPNDDIICLSGDDEEEDDDECMVVDEDQTELIKPKDEDIEVVDAKLSFSWIVNSFKDVPIHVVAIHEVGVPWVMGEPKCFHYKPLPEEVQTQQRLELTNKDELEEKESSVNDTQLPPARSSYIIPSSSSSVISNLPPQPRFVIIRPVNPPPIAPTNAIRLSSYLTPVRFHVNSPNNVQDTNSGVRDNQTHGNSDVIKDQTSVSPGVLESGDRRLSSDMRSIQHISSEVTLTPQGDDGFMEEPPSMPLFKVTNIVGSVGLEPKSAQSTSQSASPQTGSANTQATLFKSPRYTHMPFPAAASNSADSGINPSSNAASNSVRNSHNAASSINQVSNASSTNPKSADPEIVSISDDDDDDLFIIS